MKIYHTETQADYDALMVELEEQGCKWLSGNKPTEAKYHWFNYEEKTCVRVSSGILTKFDFKHSEENYPSIPITKYKAKAEEKMKFTKENVVKVVDEYFWQADFESCGDLIAAIDALDDTPEKVIVPKFVADWIEDCKSRGLGLSDLLNYWTSSVIPTEVIDFIEYDFTKIGCGHKEQELLAKAWLYGYEVEKEPLYHVLSTEGHFLLRKYEDKVCGMRLSTAVKPKDIGSADWFLLTEKEIKDYDERFWPFAVPAND